MLEFRSISPQDSGNHSSAIPAALPQAEAFMEESLGKSVLDAPVAEPVTQRERISSLDTLRGFALLGILVMNVTTFAMPGVFDFNPTAIGDIGRLNLITWAVRFVLFDGKMRAVFSMLFGAGVILLTSRLEKRGEASRAADIFTRRNMWLTLFGVLHGYFLWVGDILYFYGITALLFLYPCRKLKARTLLIAGTTAFLVAAVYHGVRFEQRRHLAQRAAVASSAEAPGQTLSEDQKDDVKAWQVVFSRTHPDQKALEKEIAEMRGGYFSVIKHYAPLISDAQSNQYYRFSFCDALGMMLIGMGLLRLGFLSAQLPYRAYAWTAVIGYAIALPLGALCAFEVWKRNFHPIAIIEWEFLPYDIQRLGVAIANASVVLMIVKAGALKWITRPLAAVGQTALSNYLGTSLICTLLFNGYGLGLFAKLQFYQLFFVVAGVWFFNLTASTLWLKYFRFGPMEWLWRSLTYWKPQPILREHAQAPAEIAPAEA
jgi:uncharacterized protein